MPYFSNEDKYIAVPAEFIKEHLPKANPSFVKVYLYLLMLASENSHAELSAVSDSLGLLESDLMLAIKYWEDEGVLFKNGDAYSFSQRFAPEPEKASAPQKTESVARIISEDKVLSDMLGVSQEILGKTLSEAEMNTIYWFYSDLKLPPEVILLLLEYCVSKGKPRMSYIEKVAISWKDMGLTTAESVALYIENEEQKSGFLYSIRKIMGISDRSLSQSEEKYLSKWHNDLSMGEEMIALAYEYCIIQTAKLSFPYMDKIITRWHKSGITTIAAAEEDNRKFKNRAKQGITAFDDNSYDHDDLEKLTRN